MVVWNDGPRGARSNGRPRPRCPTPRRADGAVVVDAGAVREGAKTSRSKLERARACACWGPNANRRVDAETGAPPAGVAQRSAVRIVSVPPRNLLDRPADFIPLHGPFAGPVGGSGCQKPVSSRTSVSGHINGNAILLEILGSVLLVWTDRASPARSGIGVFSPVLSRNFKLGTVDYPLGQILVLSPCDASGGLVALIHIASAGRPTGVMKYMWHRREPVHGRMIGAYASPCGLNGSALRLARRT
jgi:hypothetical protein